MRSVAPKSPAEAAGVKPGDIITKMGSTPGGRLPPTWSGPCWAESVGDKLDLVFRQGTETKTSAIALMMNPRNGRPQTVIAAKPSQPSIAAPASAVGVPPIGPQTSEANHDKSWEVLGLKLTGIPNGASLLAKQPYHGGLVVTDVRTSSPAESTGIKKGDVLVGLHVWETIKQEDVDYVLTSPDGRAVNPLKFYILRDGDTLFGHFTIGANPNVSRVTGP